MHSCPKTLFVLDFAKNTSHPNLGSASPFILCRFCRLKKVFDPEEMLRPAHFCGKGKKFKSILATLLVTINDHHSTILRYSIYSQRSTCEDDTTVGYFRGKKVLTLQFVGTTTVVIVLSS